MESLKKYLLVAFLILATGSTFLFLWGVITGNNSTRQNPLTFGQDEGRMLKIDSRVLEVPSSYAKTKAVVGEDIVGKTSTVRIGANSPEVTYKVTRNGKEYELSVKLLDVSASSPTIKENKITWEKIFPDINLEYDTYDGFIKETFVLNKDNSRREFFYDLSPSSNVLLDDSEGGHIKVRDKDTKDIIFMLRAPQGIDSLSYRIDYKYELTGNKLRLHPASPWQFKYASFPLKIDPTISNVNWYEALIRVGEDCNGSGCDKDGDILDIKPTGWNWGTEERRRHVIVMLPIHSDEEVRDILSRTITPQDPKHVGRDSVIKDYPDKLKDLVNSKADLVRYGIDYTSMVDPHTLAVIRDTAKTNYAPIIDQRNNLNAVKKKSNPLLSVIPDSRRLAYKTPPKPGILAVIFRKIVPFVHAVTIDTKTIGSGARDYSSISTWESTENTGDYTSSDKIESGELYNDSTFTITAATTVDGGTNQDATRYLQLTVAAGQRHAGVATSGVLLDCSTNAVSALQLQDDFARIEWVRITSCRGANGVAGIRAQTATNMLVQNVIVYNFDDATFSVSGIRLIGSGDADSITIRNSAVYDTDESAIRGDANASSTLTVQNVTIWGGNGATSANGFNQDSSAFTITNTISMSNNGSDFPTATQDHNISEDATAAGTGSLTSQSTTGQFVNTTAGSEDFHLVSTSTARNAGTTIAAFSVDLEGITRAGTWDIGADEYGYPTMTTSTSSTGASVTNHDVTLPSSIAAGDLVVALISADSGAGSFTWPSPWVEIRDEAGTGIVFTAAYLIASGGETTVTATAATGERSNHISFRVAAAEWHGTTPPELSTGTFQASTNANPDPDSLTPSWGAEDTLWVAIAAVDDSAAPSFTGFPTNYSDNNVSNIANGSAGSIGIASRGLRAASENPGTFTLSVAETWNAYTLGVRPAAAATPTPTSAPGSFQFEGLQIEGLRID